MASRRVTDSLEALADALASLEEAAAEPMDPKGYMREVVIQRFEYTVEQFRKAFVKLTEEQANAAVPTGKAVQEANKLGVLHRPELWLTLIDLRNETSHMYDKKRAQEIHALVMQYLPELRDTLLHLQRYIAES